ncbi:MAG: UDP-glucose--hexose-1-phosphate uridylyltransferase [Lactobacillaceae bacterium]|jgi:UDPglucose--hexose-1-phosphate uridylyltransferase|nr:UDP-glucose--hexose-1-phosphate uridylyltransferase [Lactobacillaceae bacterium]
MNTANQFADLVIKAGYTFQPLDKLYLVNQIYALVGTEHQQAGVEQPTDILAVRDALIEIAVLNKQIVDDLTAREILGSQLMDLLAPTPSQINQTFQTNYQIAPRTATDAFFKFAKDTDYIKTRAIAKNIAYLTPTEYGQLEITINLSKPEKDPKAIAAAGKVKSTTYPMCVLCIENEGYLGHLGWPARSEHRIIRWDLAGETWGIQYSPYAYFNEHAIFIAPKHRPMHIDAITFKNLLSLVAAFPDYFVGANADLPIVGGSLLSHDHYQGGRHTFPMAQAPIERTFNLPSFDAVTAGVVKWPMSVIRLASSAIDELVAAADHILTTWQSYSHPELNIQSVDKNGILHHTITPIARFRNNQFELDLVLRDNNTNAQYPDGIFHPHPAVQHIKKENIGLIEVMGLAILPARLKTELLEVERYLQNQPNTLTPQHKPWADELKAIYSAEQDVHEFVQQATGQVFAQVLADAGVFKRDTVGQTAFDQFIMTL